MTARPVVIGYDGSAEARAAIEHAAALLPGRDAVVVSVWAPIEKVAPVATLAAPGNLALAGARNLDRRERERHEQLAAEGAEFARQGGLVAESRAVCREGSPWRALVEMAAELDAAAIVTGTRGRSLATKVLGSTAEGVLHHAKRPVLLVPRG
jgi:nucleotide-binding universal stress UspA family protein